MTVPPKPTPFSRALDDFERIVREHQMEQLPDYKRDLARGVASQRKKIVELYHAKMKEPRTSSSK